MIVDKGWSPARPSSMVLATYGQLRSHDTSSSTPSSDAPEILPEDNKKQMSPTTEIGQPDDSSTLKKGVLWYCKDTLLSRWNWKERYFILTKDYLSCFKKAKNQYSDMGAFLFKLPLASLLGVEWDRLRGTAIVAVTDPKEGRLLIRSTQDVLDQWYKILKKAVEGSKERRRFLRLSSTNLTAGSAGSGSGSGSGSGPLRSSFSDSSPAIDRLCERVEREVWGGGRAAAPLLMRRQKSELDASAILRRNLHYCSQKRMGRRSVMPDVCLSDSKQPINDTMYREKLRRRNNDSLDSTGQSSSSPSTTPSKCSVSSTDGPIMLVRDSSGGLGISLRSPPDGSGGGGGGGGGPTEGGGVVLRAGSVRRRSRGRAAAAALRHGDHIRPHSILCDTPSDPSDVILRRKERSPQINEEQKVKNRRSCDLSALNRRSAYLTQYEH